VTRRLLLFLMTVAAALATAAPAAADDFRPAYLQLSQTGADRYDVLWKVPALTKTGL
jgi:hypothetical protein